MASTGQWTRQLLSAGTATSWSAGVPWWTPRSSVASPKGQLLPSLRASECLEWRLWKEWKEICIVLEAGGDTPFVRGVVVLEEESL